MRETLWLFRGTLYLPPVLLIPQLHLPQYREQLMWQMELLVLREAVPKRSRHTIITILQALQQVAGHLQAAVLLVLKAHSHQVQTLIPSPAAQLIIMLRAHKPLPHLIITILY